MSAGMTNAIPTGGGGLKVIASASKSQVQNVPFAVSFPTPVAYLLLTVWDLNVSETYPMVDGYYMLLPGDSISNRGTTAPYITFDGQTLTYSESPAYNHETYLSYLALG